MLLATLEHDAFVWSLWRRRRAVPAGTSSSPTPVPPPPSTETVWFAYSLVHSTYLHLVQGEESWTMLRPDEVPFAVRAGSEPELRQG